MEKESERQRERKRRSSSDWAHLLEERVEKDNGLDGFSEAHLISQNGIGALSPGEAKPVETLQLVQVQRPARQRDKVRLLLILDCRLQKTNRRQGRIWPTAVIDLVGVTTLKASAKEKTSRSSHR